MRAVARVLLSIAWAGGCACADAAELQHGRPVSGAEIHLSDLFTDVDHDQDVVLGDAPAPGNRITIGSAQLSAIAAQFGVDWTATTGREYRILERDGAVIDDALVRRKVLDALSLAGVASDSLITINSHPALVVEDGSEVEFTASTIDQAGGGFHGTLVATIRGQEVARYPIGGIIEATVRLMVATHDLPAGTLLGADDLAPAVLARSRAGDGFVQEPAQAIGRVTARALRAGAPVRLREIHLPLLVTKGGGVLLLLSEDGLDVSAQGQAIDGGALDESVRVLNVTSRAILTGDVIGPAQVRIAPHSIPIFVPSSRTYPGGSDRSIAAGVALPPMPARTP